MLLCLVLIHTLKTPNKKCNKKITHPCCQKTKLNTIMKTPKFQLYSLVYIQLKLLKLFIESVEPQASEVVAVWWENVSRRHQNSRLLKCRCSEKHLLDKHLSTLNSTPKSRRPLSDLDEMLLGLATITFDNVVAVLSSEPNQNSLSGNSRENSFIFSCSTKRFCFLFFSSHLEIRDWKRAILILLTKFEICLTLGAVLSLNKIDKWCWYGKDFTLVLLHCDKVC